MNQLEDIKEVVSPPPPTNCVLSLRSVVAGYGGEPVVEIEALDVLGGAVVALLGSSGAGKTTALKAIAGAIPPMRGDILIDGHAYGETGRVRRTARTLQNFPLLHWLSVRGNLLLAARIRGVTLVDPLPALRKFHADHLVDRMPKELSGGERCRASLSNAIVGTSHLRVLCLDEPFAGLDAATKGEVAQSLLDFVREQRCAALFVTHDLHDASEFADEAVVLSGYRPSRISGRVQSMREPAERRMRELLGIA